MITASIIVLDLFLLYASISLIGVFFPAEVSDKCPNASDKELDLVFMSNDSSENIKFAIILHTHHNRSIKNESLNMYIIY
jgi:hypothetical protein